MMFAKGKLLAMSGLIVVLSPVLSSASPEAVVTGWLEERGCTLSNSDLLDLALSDDGISPMAARDALDAMIESGTARRDQNNAVVLVSGDACEGTPVDEMKAMPGSPEDVLISIFEDNDCLMTQRAAVEQARAAGMSMGDLNQAGEAIEDAGGFIDTAEGLKLVIGDVCSPSS